jgi:hypothetical protein
MGDEYSVLHLQKDKLNRAGKSAVMYAAEAGRLEVGLVFL